VSLAYIARPNELVAWAGPIAYVVFMIWYVVLSYLVLPRIWFAWGMDRLGPRWFTEISPRWASPIKNYVLAFALSEALIVAYVVSLSRGEYFFETMMATGLDVVFAGTIIALAGLVFPWSRRARHLWPTAPLAGRRILGVPVITAAAAIGLMYNGLIAWFLFVRPEMRDISWVSGVMFAAVLAGSVVWYLFWRRRYRERGIDMDRAHRDLPPE
jgi:amino acid transporter